MKAGKSLYFGRLQERRSEELKRYGTEEQQTINAINFINSIENIKNSVLKVPYHINAGKVVDILRKTSGVNWACVTAVYKNYDMVETW